MNRKGFLFAFLVILALILLAVFLARRSRESAPPHRVAMQSPDLYREAAGPVSPDSLGPAWPGEETLRALRAEWHALGSRDSTICEELTRAGAYSEGSAPLVLPCVPRMPAGRGLDLAERLRLGEGFLTHPRWRTGALRHYPVLAGMLSTTEKSALAYLSGPNRKPTTLDSLATGLDLPVAEVRPAVAALESVGWLRRGAGADSALYAIVDPSIARGGALQYVTVTPAQGAPVDLVTIQAAFTRTAPTLYEDRVVLRGPCAATGRVVAAELGQGRLFRGRPGNAWVAEIQPLGRSSGLFVSQRALDRWLEQHPEVQVGAQSALLDSYLSARERGGN